MPGCGSPDPGLGLREASDDKPLAIAAARRHHAGLHISGGWDCHISKASRLLVPRCGVNRPWPETAWGGRPQGACNGRCQALPCSGLHRTHTPPPPAVGDDGGGGGCGHDVNVLRTRRPVDNTVRATYAIRSCCRHWSVCSHTDTRWIVIIWGVGVGVWVVGASHLQDLGTGLESGGRCCRHARHAVAATMQGLAWMSTFMPLSSMV